MDLKQIRKLAKQRLKQNYFKNILVVFVATFILTGGISYTSKNFLDIDISNKSAIKVLSFYRQRSNSEVINDFIDNVINEQEKQEKVVDTMNNGFMSTFVNILSANRSMIFNMISGVTNAITGKMSSAIVAILATLLYLAFRYFFLAAIEVGRNRYYLEQRMYLGTHPDRIAFPYKKKRVINVCWVLFVRMCLLTLWSLTIIGYFINYYNYLMVPYILAENPNIKAKDALKLSKQMVYGHRFQLFKVSLLIIAWHLLGLVTFNMSNIFFVNAYEQCMFAEIYMALRREKRPKLELKELLNDAKLSVTEQHKGSYPEKNKENELVKAGAAKKYSILTYILLFFCFSFIGWAYEVLLYLIDDGKFVNRGTLYGPWLPIYGVGGVSILFALQKFRKSPLAMFLSSFVLCGIVEYAGGWYLEKFCHMRYWDYSGYVLNLNGHICLESLLIFGLGGCGFTYIAAPLLDDVLKKMQYSTKVVLCAILLSTFAIDFIYTQVAGPNSGEGISSEIQEQ